MDEDENSVIIDGTTVKHCVVAKTFYSWSVNETRRQMVHDNANENQLFFFLATMARASQEKPRRRSFRQCLVTLLGRIKAALSASIQRRRNLFIALIITWLAARYQKRRVCTPLNGVSDAAGVTVGIVAK